MVRRVRHGLLERPCDLRLDLVEHGVVLGEAFLSFLGMGIEPPKASWGTLAQDGYTSYLAHPYIIVIPSLCISWLILSAFFIADGLRDALDPRTRQDF